MTTSFWVILLVVLVYGLVHSLLATLQAKAQARQWFGPAVDRWFRLFYNFIATASLLPILILPVILVDKELYRIPFPWVVLSIAGQGLAVIAVVVGLKQTGVSSFLGFRQLLRPADDRPAKFVTDGLYRWVRHPLYTAGLIFIWLFPIMTCNLLAINIGLTIYIVVGALFEERRLSIEFGQVYSEYKAHTPMLIPGLKRRN